MTRNVNSEHIAHGSTWHGSWKPLTYVTQIFQACYLCTFNVATIFLRGHPYIWHITACHGLFYPGECSLEWDYGIINGPMPNTWSKSAKVCIKNACVGYLLVFQEGDDKWYILYEQFRRIPHLISCARVTGWWVLPSHAQNAVRNITHWVLHSLLIVIVELKLFFSDFQALWC